MIAVENLSKYFHKTQILHSINLRLESKVYGLLGPNGAGKTTLLRCLAGLYEPQQGVVTYKNESITMSKRYRRELGYLPQEFGLFHELTLYEMMDYICSLKSIARSQCDSEISRALKSVNLEDRARDRIKSLSGGMVRRAGIAQAILGDTKVLLFDEPTVGLDPGERARFKNIVSELKKDKVILISTHIVEDVDACCSSVVVIDEGRILFNGTCEELKQVAINRVYLVSEADSQCIAGESFTLKITETEGQVYHRILAKNTQHHQSERPTLEDGYMCLVKGLA